MSFALITTVGHFANEPDSFTDEPTIGSPGFPLNARAAD